MAVSVVASSLTRRRMDRLRVTQGREKKSLARLHTASTAAQHIVSLLLLALPALLLHMMGLTAVLEK